MLTPHPQAQALLLDIPQRNHVAGIRTRKFHQHSFEQSNLTFSESLTADKMRLLHVQSLLTVCVPMDCLDALRFLRQMTCRRTHSLENESPSMNSTHSKSGTYSFFRREGGAIGKTRTRDSSCITGP